MKNNLLDEKIIPHSQSSTSKYEFPTENYSTKWYVANRKCNEVNHHVHHCKKQLAKIDEYRNSITTSNSSNVIGQLEDECSVHSNTDDQTMDHPRVDSQPEQSVSPCLNAASHNSDKDRYGTVPETLSYNKEESDAKDTVTLNSCEESDAKDTVALNSSNTSSLSVTIPDFMCGEFKRMKLVSLEFYSYLAESTIQKKTPVKPSKKRKRKPAFNPKKKKKNMSCDDNSGVIMHDPYQINLENACSEEVEYENNIALVVHLGVGRPMYPVIHRNLITLCQQKDNQVTAKWAEFALSTLIVSSSDCGVKTILMPVVDNELMSAISNFHETQNAEFDEIDLKKVVQPKCLQPTYNIPELNAPAEKKEENMKPSLQLCQKLKSICNRSSLIDQIYQQSLKNKKEIQPVNDPSPQKSPQTLQSDEEILHKHGYRPCWVRLPKLKCDQILNDGAAPKLQSSIDKEFSQLPQDIRIGASLEKEANFQSESLSPFNEKMYSRITRTFLKKLDDTVPAKSSQDSMPTQMEKADSSISSRTRKGSSQPVSVKKRNISNRLRPADSVTKETTPRDPMPSIVSQQRVTHIPITSAKKKTAVWNEQSLTVSMKKRNVPSQMPPTTLMNPSICSQLDALNKNTHVSLSENVVRTYPFGRTSSLADQGPLQTSDFIANATHLTAVKQLISPQPKNWPVSIDNDLPPPVTPSVQVEIFGDEVDDEEWISMEHYFGTEHCSKTYGPMIDFRTRNKTLIYFYKMRRILKFQTTNNKYFQSCTYIQIQKSMQGSSVDIEIDPLEDTGEVDEKVSSGPRSFKDVLKDKGYMVEPDTPDPLKIMKMPRGENLFGQYSLKDTNNQIKYDFRPIEKNSLKNLSNTKWIILRLGRDVESIIFNERVRWSSKLLFEIMYRADLTKKIICHTIEEGNSGSTGLYGIPGVCDSIVIGPCQTPERFYSLRAVLSIDLGSTVEIPITTSRMNNATSYNSDHGIEAVWWRPVNVPLKVSCINAAYLNFLFKWDTGTTHLAQLNEKFHSRNNKQHQQENVIIVSDSEDDHYVLKHNLAGQSPAPALAVIPAPALPPVNIYHRPLRPKLVQKQIQSDLGESRECVLPRTPPRYPQRRCALVNELNRCREQTRRETLSKHRDRLQSLLTFPGSFPRNHVPLKLIMKVAKSTIQMLEKRHSELLQERAIHEYQRKRLFFRFLSYLRDMPDRSAAYKQTKSVVAMLVPPTRAENVVWEEHRNGGCSSRDDPAEIRHQVSASSEHRKRRKRRTPGSPRNGRHLQPARRQRRSSSSLSSVHDPIHVTVQSGNHVIGLGPYTDHTYCNSVGTNKLIGPATDPLVETEAIPDAVPDAMDEKGASDSINICVTREGQPVFKLVINRTGGSKGATSNAAVSGVDMKRQIQRVLDGMLDQLNKDGCTTGKQLNNVQLLQNIVSDARNASLFSQVPDVRRATCEPNYNPSSSVHVTQNSSDEVPARTQRSMSESFLPRSRNKSTRSEERFVSLDKFIDESMVLKRRDRVRQLPVSDRLASVPSSMNTLLPKDVTLEECVIEEEECIENSLPVEAEFSSNDTNPVFPKKPFISVKKNVVLTRSSPSKMNLSTIPILRKVYDGNVPIQRSMPIILRKVNGGVIKPKKKYVIIKSHALSSLVKAPSVVNRVRCPSFVPITRLASSAPLRRAVSDERYGTENTSPGAEEATITLIESEDEDESVLVERPTSLIQSESVEVSPHGEAATEDANGDVHYDSAAGDANGDVHRDSAAGDANGDAHYETAAENANGENEQSAPFRLSVKRFASLNTLKDEMCSNVDKLLKF